MINLKFLKRIFSSLLAFIGSIKCLINHHKYENILCGYGTLIHTHDEYIEEVILKKSRCIYCKAILCEAIGATKRVKLNEEMFNHKLKSFKENFKYFKDLKLK